MGPSQHPTKEQTLISTRIPAVAFRSQTATLAIGLMAAMPAMAANLPAGLSFTPRDYLLMSGAVLLAVALAFRLMKRRETGDATPDGPDLRWWKEFHA